MTKITHIISDLHLCQSRPDLFSLFKHYIKEIAPKCEQLYVLGDLFEVWLGDDCLISQNPSKNLYHEVIALFKNYSEQQGKLFFIHGNRDFLLGSTFEDKVGGQLLQEPYFIELAQMKIAFIHGDTLCTDDIDYQKFREIVREPNWQREFLAQPITKRIEIAENLRQQSQQAQLSKPSKIMDVNHQSVSSFFTQHDIDCLIHGHTHRQAVHEYTINNRARQRIVLSDWDAQGFYLSIDNNEITPHYFTTED